MADNKISTQRVWDMAYQGDLEGLKSLSLTQDDADMAIMGASSASFELLKGAQFPEEIKTILPTLDEKTRKQAKVLSDIVWYGVSQGGCLLWSIQQTEAKGGETKQNSFFSRVSMRKGPGDIQKGSFKGK